MKHLILICWFLLITVFGHAEEATILVFKGYLGKEQLAPIQKKLDEPIGKELIIEVSSSSGDILEMLTLAKKIYEKKVENNFPIVVYINDNALGPAAILPFLADKLYTSLVVSWGDIPLGSENVVSTNILRNRVVSLISPNHPQAQLLSVLATGMTDPSIKIVDDHGWKISTTGSDSLSLMISSPGETLVVNHHQLKELGLIAGQLPEDRFRALFKLNEVQQAQWKEPPQSNESLAISQLALEESLKKHIQFNPSGPNKIGYIKIEGSDGISQATWLYVKHALDYYKEKKPVFIILELNTPGGEVFSAQQISDALKEMDTQFNIPVVAFINNWAISAGAMLAYSTRFIAVSKDASMGAAEPLIMEGGKAEVASEKVNSAMRADFANRAAFFGRNPYIAEAMVDKDTILVVRHGKIIKLDAMDQIRKGGSDPDILINPKGKLLTFNSDQLMKYGVADFLLLPQRLEEISAQEKEKGEWPAKKMLLSTVPFFEKIPNATVDQYKMDWKTRFFVWLASPFISSLLFLGLILGIYLELNMPGFGLAGTLAVTCLFLIILSSFAFQIANWLELILLLTGLAIILIELFVLPTFGLLGIIGVIFFLVGLFGMMLPGAGAVNFELDTQTFNAAGQIFFERLAWLCGTLVLAFGIILLLGRYMTPKLAGFSKFVLAGHEQKGYIAGDNPQDLPGPGSKGEAIATLRPSGKVMINDRLYDAISSGSFIEKGEEIVVDHLDGSVIVVRKLEG